jgi:Uma2 family endonuclease
MAENTRQFRYIVTIQGGLDALYRNDPNVFVAGDLFWYPVEGDNKLRTAPDVLVAFGRPKGDRGSYLQWVEDNVSPQVVFEVLSPGNSFREMLNKFRFYERYGVEEYYLYDPDEGELEGWLRAGGELREIPDMAGWVSPRLKVRFELVAGGLELYGPDGQKFRTYLELEAQREQAQRHADEAQQRAERLAAQLRSMGVEPER